MVKGVPTDLTDEDFKEFLDLNKISYAKAERYKSKKDGRVLPMFQLNFMGLNITFWNCHGIRSKRKELELYLNDNSIDIIALNETFLNKQVNFKIQGYDTIRKTVRLA